MTNAPLPDVSVIIPAHNAALYLGRAIDSAVGQEGCQLEVLVVNNNSTDDTVLIAEAYENRYPGQVRLLHEIKPGPSSTRNRGFAAARGSWIQFLDADDILLPGKLTRQLTLAAPGVNWILGKIRIQEINGDITDAITVRDHWLGLLTYTGMGHLNANLFSAESLRQVGGFAEDYRSCEDFELFFRMIQLDNNPLIDDTPGAVHIHHSGLRASNSRLQEMAKLRIRLTTQIIEFLREDRPDYFLQHQKQAQSSMLNCIRQQMTVDFGRGVGNFHRFFPSGYLSEEVDRSLLPGHAVLYPIFGFVWVEWWRTKFSTVVPAGLRRKLKSGFYRY